MRGWLRGERALRIIPVVLRRGNPSRSSGVVKDSGSGELYTVICPPGYSRVARLPRLPRGCRVRTRRKGRASNCLYMVMQNALRSISQPRADGDRHVV